MITLCWITPVWYNKSRIRTYESYQNAFYNVYCTFTAVHYSDRIVFQLSRRGHTSEFQSSPDVSSTNHGSLLLRWSSLLSRQWMNFKWPETKENTGPLPLGNVPRFVPETPGDIGSLLENYFNSFILSIFTYFKVHSALMHRGF